MEETRKEEMRGKVKGNGRWKEEGRGGVEEEMQESRRDGEGLSRERERGGRERRKSREEKEWK